MTIPVPTVTHRFFCWQQQIVDGLPRSFVRCLFARGHTGRHSWEPAARPPQIHADQHGIPPRVEPDPIP
jgi:hypothetical protein